MAEIKRPYKIAIYVAGVGRYLVEVTYIIEYSLGNSQLVWDTVDTTLTDYDDAYQMAKNLSGLYNVPMESFVPLGARS